MGEVIKSLNRAQRRAILKHSKTKGVLHMSQRTAEEIQKDYIAQASRAGDAAYRARCFEKEASDAQEKMLELNNELVALNTETAAKAEQDKNADKV